MDPPDGSADPPPRDLHASRRPGARNQLLDDQGEWCRNHNQVFGRIELFIRFVGRIKFHRMIGRINFHQMIGRIEFHQKTYKFAQFIDDIYIYMYYSI